MAIPTYDNSGSAAVTSNTTVTISAFSVAGDFIFVGIGCNPENVSGGLSFTVTRNGTEVFTQTFLCSFTADPWGTSAGYYFKAPATGSYSIVVVCNKTCYSLFAGAISLSGVNQTTPIGTPVTNVGNNDKGQDPTVTCPAADDELLVDSAWVWTDEQCDATGTDHIRRQAQLSGGWGWVAGTRPGSYDDVMSYDSSAGNYYWSIGAVPVKGAGAERKWLLARPT